MIRFTLDPALARQAVLEGREIIIEVESQHVYRAVIGQPSKHKRHADAVALEVPQERKTA